MSSLSNHFDGNSSGPPGSTHVIFPDQTSVGNIPLFKSTASPDDREREEDDPQDEDAMDARVSHLQEDEEEDDSYWKSRREQEPLKEENGLATSPLNESDRRPEGEVERTEEEEEDDRASV